MCEQKSSAIESKVTANNVSASHFQPGLFHLLMCAIGICSCYLYYGMVQESLFSGRRVGPTFVLVTQCITNALVALVWQQVDQLISKRTTETSKTPTGGFRQIHHPLLVGISLCYVLAMGCSNEALHFVTYPTAVLAKSCKLIPTMIMGVLVEGRSYMSIEWMAALLISAGIVIFNMSRLTSHDDEEGNSTIGLSLLAFSLIMDGLLGSTQGILKKTNGSNSKWCVRPPNAVETMLFVNFYSVFFLLPVAIYKNQFDEGLRMLLGGDSAGDDQDLLVDLMVLNSTVACGQIFIFLTITWFSSIVCTTITTTRKFFTILLSVSYFGHRFSISQWTAIFLVFSGLYLGILAQRQMSLAVAKAKED